MKAQLKTKYYLITILVSVFLAALASQAQDPIPLSPMGNDGAALLAPPPTSTKPVIMFCACTNGAESTLAMVVRHSDGQIQQLKLGPFYYAECLHAIEENPACPKGH